MRNISAKAFRMRNALPRTPFRGGLLMARRRLSPTPFFDAGPTPGPAGRPPIAQQMGEAARDDALEKLSAEIAAARAEGRLIQSLPVAAIVSDHLIRDRMAVDADDLDALIESIRARGQQVPVEVMALDDGRYGLISGWRRLMALNILHRETEDDRFATALAILRRPADLPEAYLAMVEENEIRVGLSFYERARIVARAAEAEVFETEPEALSALFASATRSRRSKIGSFLWVVHDLGEVLKFPEAIPERLGLKLAQRLRKDFTFAGRVGAALSIADPQTAEAELAVLNRLAQRPNAAPAEDRPAPAPARVRVSYDPGAARLTLTGVDPALARRLKAWLKEQQGGG
jgi:ParB family transcriptional regulator, chromosome partitioning protein